MAAKVGAEQSSSLESGKEVGEMEKEVGEMEKEVGEDQVLLQKERFGFVFEAFARGPDAVYFGSVYFPALLVFATMDSVCSDRLERQRPERLALPTLPGTGHFG